jgi:DNA-binding response OmpR family regulator
MAKKILLIESDGAFAQELSAAIEARGLEARVTADGKEGLDLARADRPALIVLCVELPKMSGYSVCNKLKKDDELRTIPLVIISAEATAETFDQHRKLKTHADDYLIKPFAPAELLKKIAGLVELPAEGADEELVTLDDVEELESLGAAPVELDAPAIQAAAASSEDDDLKLLDDAFDSLATDDSTAMTAIDGAPPSAPAPAAAPPETELEVALDVEPASADVAAPPEVERLGDEADAALAALGADDPAELVLPDPVSLLDDGPTPSGEDLLRRAGIDLELPPAPPVPEAVEPAPRAVDTASAAELAEARERADGLERELETVRAELKEQQERSRAATAARQGAEEQARAARAQAKESAARAGELESGAAEAEARAEEAEQRAARADESAAAAVARAEASERQAAELRHEAARASGEAAQARERAEELAKDLQQAQARAGEHESAVAALRPELESLRNELAEAQGSAASARADVERALRDREKRVAELEAQNAKHEERVVKAYQKIKGDEKIREKARKALAIALQLLEDRSAPPASAGEVQPRRE